MGIFGERIKDRANKLLPKVLEIAEKELGYNLPEVKIVNVNAYAQGNFYEEDYTIQLGGVFVDAIISKKDGSLGRMKKIVNSVIENILVGSGYDYREIYITFNRGEPTEFVNENESKSKSTEKYLQLLKNTLEGDRQFTGWYSMPYSTSDEDKVDVIVKYHVNRISLWKESPKPKFGNCQYGGTVFLKLDDVKVGFEHLDDWESAHIHDLPSWLEDDFKDSILNELSIYQNICLDIDYDK